LLLLPVNFVSIEHPFDSMLYKNLTCFVLFGSMNIKTKIRALLLFPTRIYVFLSDRYLLFNSVMKKLIFMIFLASVKAGV
jgi:hypothetical protein